MNKRGDFRPGDWGTLVLCMIISWILLALYIQIIVPSLSFSKGEDDRASYKDMNSKVFTRPFMMSEFDGESMSDIIVMSYINGDYELFKEKTTEVLTRSYGVDVSWEAKIDGETVAEREAEDGHKRNSFSYKVSIPLLDLRYIEFELIVHEPYDPGYGLSYWGE